MATEPQISNQLVAESQHEKRVGVKLTKTGLARAINAEMRAYEAKQGLLAQAEVEPEPVYVPKPITAASALEKTVVMLTTGPQGVFQSTVNELARWLPTHKGLRLQNQYRKNLPVDQALVREALAAIYAEHQRRQQMRISLRRAV